MLSVPDLVNEKLNVVSMSVFHDRSIDHDPSVNAKLLICGIWLLKIMLLVPYSVVLFPAMSATCAVRAIAPVFVTVASGTVKVNRSSSCCPLVGVILVPSMVNDTPVSTSLHEKVTVAILGLPTAHDTA